MTNRVEFECFMNAACMAVSDFSGQSLGLNEPIEPSSMERMNREDCSALIGSYLSLQCGDNQVDVALLSNEDVLMNIAKRMLDMDVDEPLPREHMIDAVNEAINIISGGIKSNLNHSVDGGIILGIPSFVDGKYFHKKNENEIIGKIVVVGMPVFISVRPGI